MPKPLTPKANIRMFCRMMRTVSRARRISIGKRLSGVAHHDDVARLGGDVGAGAADGDADISAGQRRGVVDTVADHGHDVRPAPFFLSGTGVDSADR